MTRTPSWWPAVVLAVLGSACAHTGPPTVGEPIASLWLEKPERVRLGGDRVRMEFDGTSASTGSRRAPLV